MDERLRSVMKEYDTIVRCIYRAKISISFRNKLIEDFQAADLLTINVPCGYNALRVNLDIIVNIQKYSRIIQFQEKVFKFITENSETTARLVAQFAVN